MSSSVFKTSVWKLPATDGEAAHTEHSNTNIDIEKRQRCQIVRNIRYRDAMSSLEWAKTETNCFTTNIECEEGQ